MPSNQSNPKVKYPTQSLRRAFKESNGKLVLVVVVKKVSLRCNLMMYHVLVVVAPGMEGIWRCVCVFLYILCKSIYVLGKLWGLLLWFFNHVGLILKQNQESANPHIAFSTTCGNGSLYQSELLSIVSKQLRKYSMFAPIFSFFPWQLICASGRFSDKQFLLQIFNCGNDYN